MEGEKQPRFRALETTWSSLAPQAGVWHRSPASGLCPDRSWVEAGDGGVCRHQCVLIIYAADFGLLAFDLSLS